MIYAAIGGLWILFSDSLLAVLVSDPATSTRFSIYKGWTYVLITAMLLYWLIRKYAAAQQDSLVAMDDSGKYNRALFEQSPIGLALCRMDGTLVDINQAYARVIGRSVAETLTLTYWDITPAKFADQEEGQLDSLRKTGRYGPYEKEYIHKDSRLIPVRLQGHLIEQDGEQLIWSSVEDITERKNAEDALRRSEEKFFKAFHATPDAIVITRLSDGLLLEYNEVFLKQLGFSPEEVRNRTSVELGLWADPNERQRYIAAIQKDGKAREMEAQFRTRSGAIRDGLVSGECFVLDGQPCLLTIIRDITARKQGEEELRSHREHLEELVKERTADIANKTEELEGKNRELERFNKLFVDREFRVKELKLKVQELKEQLKAAGEGS